jgi:hypothetical protein
VTRATACLNQQRIAFAATAQAGKAQGLRTD